MSQKALKDVLAGLIFIGLGLAFGAAAYRYDLGNAVRMGPGYFPLLLGGTLVLLGLGVAAAGLAGGEGEPLGPVPWRGIVLILAGILFFGATVRGLGLLPALLVTVMASALASRNTGPLAAALITLGLGVVCYLIFVAALGLNLPLVGPWLAI